MYYYNKIFFRKWPDKEHNWVYKSDLPQNENKQFFTYKKWEDWPKEEDYANIETLSISLNRNTPIKELPTFINKLINLKSLSLPIDFFIELKDQVPFLLENLCLFKQHFTRTEIDILWPRSFILEKLNAISIPELLKPFKLDVNDIPNISWLNYDLTVEKKEKIFYEFSKLEKVEHLYFSYGKSFDVFTPFQYHKINTLDLFACLGKNFPMGNIIKLKDLTSLKINNLRVPFDCSLLNELPKLQELTLWNIKNVINLNDLLLHPNLKKVDIANCGDLSKKMNQSPSFQKRFGNR